MRKINSLFVAFSLLGLISSPSLAQKKIAQPGDTVEVIYTGYLDDGRVFDSNVATEKTLAFKVGSSKVIKAFSDAIVGMQKGGVKTVKIPAEQAYGKVNAKKVIKLSSNQIPTNAEPGSRLELRSSKDVIPVRFIAFYKELDIAYVDANHLLAGKDLNFDIKLDKVTKSPSSNTDK